ncbi:MAG: hypothetical protein R3245_05945 [Kiloniellales bacterium]|nr:hypothetical protein [Kiloniellales bacterium]
MPPGEDRHTLAGEGPMLSLLSLKLLLLAFFILLNALSEIEALKVRAVLESVTKAFDGRLIVEENAAIRRAALGPLDGSEIVISDLEKYFHSLLPAFSVDENLRSRKLIVELPAGSFFAEDARRLHSGREVLFDRVADRLRSTQTGELDFEVALLHGGPQDAAKVDLRSRRVSILARELSRRGIPAHRIAIGFYPARTETLRLEFLVWHEAQPGHGTRASNGANKPSTTGRVQR